MTKKIELSPRLRMVADLVPEGVRLADVGTDHAYLPSALLQEGRIPSAIAADLRSGPLSRARNTAEECGLLDRISFCLCDGLTGIRPEQADAVSMAGMGGETITLILKAAPWTREKGIPLILQPQSTYVELRGWLMEHGYRIETEQLVRDGEMIYTAWLVRAGEMKKLSPAELWAGENRNDPLRGAWLDLWIHKTAAALRGLTRSDNEQSAQRRQMLTEVHNGLVEMKKEWEAWQ